MTHPRRQQPPGQPHRRAACGPAYAALVSTVVAGLVVLASLTPAYATAAPVPSSVAASVAALTPAALGSAPGDYTPVTGAKFNMPIGGPKQKLVLYRQVLRAIRSTPSGGTIRAAVFSFAEKNTSQALLAAAARGVKVQLVFAGDRQFPSVRRLARVLGTDTSRPSSVVLCDASCRGSRGQMHAKFFQFSRVGGARWVTMVGSNNITRFNSDEQWSDIYTVVNDRPYYRAFVRWFRQLQRDTPLPNPYVQERVGTNTITMTPFDPATQPDPVMEELAPVGCVAAAGPTSIMIAAHAWNGERGKTIARRVAGLVRDGCQVHVVLGIGTGAAVRAILEGPGTYLTSGTHPGVYTHEKLLIVHGQYGADPDALLVWTGSHNWSDRATHRDDLIVGIDDPVVGNQYIGAFQRMWRLG